jgi:hypothetical protein
MTQQKEISGDLDFEFFVAGVAAGTAIEWPLIVLPYNMRVQTCRWVPSAAVTANGSNYATLSFRNRTGAGAGTAVPASRAYSATNSVAQVAEAMTLSGTSSDLDCSTGDVLTLGVVHTGTGLVIPAGLVQLKMRAR